jgi:hypothetical protein
MVMDATDNNSIKTYQKGFAMAGLNTDEYKIYHSFKPKLLKHQMVLYFIKMFV